MKGKLGSIDINTDKGKKMRFAGRGFVALFLSVCIAGVSICVRTGMVCEAKTNETFSTDDNVKKEMEEFVTAFYETHTKEKLFTLQEYVEDEESLPEYLLEYETAFSCGVIGYDNIDVSVYPLDDGEYWMAFVCSDMIVENIDIGLPGAAALVVHRKQDGSMFIVLDPDTLDSSFLDTLTESMRNLMVLDEIVDMQTKQSASYNEILAENEDIAQWTISLSDALTKARAEAVSAQYAEEEGGLYTVKKGDCLWDIAEAELGDGMYWMRIYKANQDVIGDNPDVLFVGIQIRIDK